MLIFENHSLIRYPIVKSFDAIIVKIIAKIIEINNDVIYDESDIPKQVYLNPLIIQYRGLNCEIIRNILGKSFIE